MSERVDSRDRRSGTDHRRITWGRTRYRETVRRLSAMVWFPWEPWVATICLRTGGLVADKMTDGLDKIGAPSRSRGTDQETTHFSQKKTGYEKEAILAQRKTARQAVSQEVRLLTKLQEISKEVLKLTLKEFVRLLWRATLWKRPGCWERLRAGGEGDDRGCDGWMASPT